MQPSPRLVTNGTGGELSPKLSGQFDHPMYAKGWTELENMMIESHGGIQNRPGLHLVITSVDTVPHRLIPVVHGYNDGYVLRIESGAIEVWSQAGALVTTLTSTHAYATADLPLIQYQAVRVSTSTYVYLCHPSWSVIRVEYDGSTWTKTVGLTVTGATIDSSNNRPRTVGVYEQRLWFAGTNNAPTTILGSKSGDFTNFTVGTNDADGLSYTIQGINNAGVEWLVSSSEGILIGSMYGEGMLTGGASPLTPNNRFFRWLTAFGSERIQAVPAADAAIFLQIGGRIVREYYYEGVSEAYKSPDLTFHADHILGDSGATHFAYQRKPDSNLMFIRSDGLLALCTYQRLYEITGWQRWETDGDFVSICVLPMSGVEERIFVETKRTLAGATKYSLEYFDYRLWTDRRVAHYLDAGIYVDYGTSKTVNAVEAENPFKLTLGTGHGLTTGQKVRITGMTSYDTVNNRVWTITTSGTDKITLDGCDGSGFAVETTGLGELERVDNKIASASMYGYQREISIVADGAVQPAQTYSSGDLTLEVYANKIHVGLPYTCTAELMPMAFFRTQRLDRVYLRFLDTVGCKVGVSESALKPIIFRKVTDPMGVAPPLFTGDKEMELDADYDTTGRLLIVQDQPLPFHLLAILADQTTYMPVPAAVGGA